MSEPLEQLLIRARRNHTAMAHRAATSKTSPGPGFVDRVLRQAHHQQQLNGNPLWQLERAALLSAGLAACITFTFWVLPAPPHPQALDAAAQTWLDIPGEDIIWGDL